MEPTLRSGQFVLLDRGHYRTHAVERGDVVVFRWQGQVYVKRVYALPGERVELICNGGYTFPVKEGNEERVRRMVRRWTDIKLSAVTVPAGHFYALGDHLNASVDSRKIGPIPESAILGRIRC